VNPDIDQLTAICARGANLQIDHIGIPWRHSSADEQVNGSGEPDGEDAQGGGDVFA
jgi:hypothetical protein